MSASAILESKILYQAAFYEAVNNFHLPTWFDYTFIVVPL